MHRLLSMGAVLAAGILITACGGSSSSGSSNAVQAASTPPPAIDPTVPDRRLAVASELTDSWCRTAFRHVSGFDESTISDAEIMQDFYTGFTAFSGAKSVVDASLETPIELRAYTRAWCAPELPASEDLSEYLYCKMPSQARVADILGRTPDNGVGSCRDANQEAFAWAWAQLTDTEQAEFTARGKSVKLLEDDILARGGDWLPQEPYFAPDTNGNYQLSAPSLQSSYIPSTDNATLDGVHYCTLVTPEQALYWLLHRGLKEEPGKCVAEDACLEPDTVPEGSCVFYFAATFTHMCEEYRGPYWDQTLSVEKCDSRSGSYSTDPCFDREEEVALLDSDDGGFLGTCDIACGQEERIWYLFSQSPNADPTQQACFTPAEGHPLIR